MSDEGHVQTMLGAVNPADLGLTLPHEHMPNSMTLEASSAIELTHATESAAMAAHVPEAAFEPGEEGPPG